VKPRVEASDPSRPHCVLDVEYDRGALYLVLANDGAGLARDVAVRFARPLRGVGGERDVASLAVFANLPLLRAGKGLRVFLDVAALLFRRRQATRFSAVVTYRDRDGRRFSDEFRHDLAIWRDFGEVVRPDDPT